MLTKTDVTVFIPGRLPGLNEIIAACKVNKRTKYSKWNEFRYSKYAELKQHWTQYICIVLNNFRGLNFERAWFDFCWIEKNRMRDPDNIVGGGRKFIFDSFVKLKIIPNDGWKNVAGWSDKFTVSKNFGIEVKITKMN